MSIIAASSGMTLNPQYTEWPNVEALLPDGFPGVKTSRDDFVTDIDRNRLEARIASYLDPQLSHEEAGRLFPSAMRANRRFDPVEARTRLLARGYRPEQIVRYLYRPFDERWLYWEPTTKLLDEKREEYEAQVFDGNVWLTANQRNRKEEYYQPQFTTVLADHHLVESNVTMFPLYVRSQQTRLAAGAVEGSGVPNLSDAARHYLSALQAPPEALFHHILAIIHSPSYVFVNSGALRQDWPHIPLPNDRDLLLASASLGQRLRELLDPSTSVQGVTTEGNLLEEYRRIAVPTPRSDRPIDPDAGDLALTMNWGYRNPRGAVMPGGGRALGREFEGAERAAISRAGNPLGLDMTDDVPLGEATFDVYLNDRVYWRNVPSRVWDYTLGGYSNVLKKWLSYREDDVLGRSLSVDELSAFSAIARRIAAILLLQPRLDANYRDVTASTYNWAASRSEASQTALW